MKHRSRITIPNRGRDGHSNRLKDLATSRFALASDRQRLASFLEDNVLKRFQILFDIGKAGILQEASKGTVVVGMTTSDPRWSGQE